jgi:hypothetical protein
MRPRQARHKMAWGVSDQLVWSATNFGLSAFVAVATDVRNFGIFSFFFVLFLLVVGLVTSYCADTYVVLAPSRRDTSDTSRQASVVVAAGLCSLPVVVALLGGASVLGSDMAAPARAFAVVLPFVVMQETIRILLFAAHRPAKTFANDSVWAAVMVAGLLIVHKLGRTDSVDLLILVWGCGAAVGLALGVRQLDLDLRSARPFAWLRRVRTLGWQFASDFFVGLGNAYVITWLVGLVAGLDDLASFRGSQIAFGVTTAVFQWARIGLVPAVLAKTSRHDQYDFLRRVGVMFVAVTALYGLALLMIPTSAGARVLGDVWGPMRPLIIPSIVLRSAAAVTTAAFIGLRAHRMGARTLRLRIGVAAASVAGATIGAFLAGAQGAMTVLAATTVVGAVFWWRALISATRDHSEQGPTTASPPVELREPPERRAAEPVSPSSP